MLLPRHTFIYRQHRIAVSIQRQSGGWGWVCHVDDDLPLCASHRVADSLTHALGLACEAARQALAQQLLDQPINA